MEWKGDERRDESLTGRQGVVLWPAVVQRGPVPVVGFGLGALGFNS